MKVNMAEAVDKKYLMDGYVIIYNQKPIKAAHTRTATSYGWKQCSGWAITNVVVPDGQIHVFNVPSAHQHPPNREECAIPKFGLLSILKKRIWEKYTRIW